MGMLLFSIFLQSKLSEPEFYPGYDMTVNGYVQSTEMVPNGSYVQGVKRQIYEFLMDFLPTGQMLSYANFEVQKLWLPPLYALLIFTVSTGMGLTIFQRKDLK